MNDWLSGILGDVGLNGSTAPNSGSTGLSTPVDTSNGNTNTSGSSLGGLLTGLSGIGSTALNAYNSIFGKSTTTTAAKPATTAAAAATSSLTKYLPWVLISGGVLFVILFFTRKK